MCTMLIMHLSVDSLCGDNIDSRVEGYGLEMHITHVINLPLTPILNAACPLILSVLHVTPWKLRMPLCTEKYNNPLMPHAAMHMVRSLCLFVVPEDETGMCVLIRASNLCCISLETNCVDKLPSSQARAIPSSSVWVCSVLLLGMSLLYTLVERLPGLTSLLLRPHYHWGSCTWASLISIQAVSHWHS